MKKPNLPKSNTFMFGTYNQIEIYLLMTRNVFTDDGTNLHFLSDHIFDIYASDNDIYCSVAKNLVATVMQGFNIFRKTLNSTIILGNVTEVSLFERAIDAIFSSIRQNAQKLFLL